MPSVCAIIQARSGSTRLPNKVLRTLVDHTVLGHVLLRVRASRKIDGIIVATSTLPGDDAIEQEALRYGALVFRGSETDVLSRYDGAAQRYGADTVVRMTSDCPMIDASVIDRIVQLYQYTDVDYASNVVERTYPRGLDVEVFSAKLLHEINETSTDHNDREHVTWGIRQHPERYKHAHHRHAADCSSGRWTLDTPEDWAFISAVYERIYEPGKLFSWLDVLALLNREPELVLINAHVEQKKDPVSRG